MTRIRCLAFGLFFVLILPARADETSGPPVGEKIPALKVYAVTGDPKDKEVDYAAETKDKSTVYFLVPADQWDRPMARSLKKLDEGLGKDDSEAVVAVLRPPRRAGRRFQPPKTAPARRPVPPGR